MGCSSSSASSPIGVRIISTEEIRLVNGRQAVEHVVELSLPVPLAESGFLLEYPKEQESSKKWQRQRVVIKGVADDSLLDRVLTSATDASGAAFQGGCKIMAVDDDVSLDAIMQKLSSRKQARIKIQRVLKSPQGEVPFPALLSHGGAMSPMSTCSSRTSASSCSTTTPAIALGLADTAASPSGSGTSRRTRLQVSEALLLDGGRHDLTLSKSTAASGCSSADPGTFAAAGAESLEPADPSCTLMAV